MAMSLVAGRELDALVAEKVMGWPVKKNEYGEWVLAKRTPDAASCSNGYSEYDIPDFSHDIAAAWEVVERFTKAQEVIGHGGGVDLLDEWQFRLQWNHNWMWDARFDRCVDRNSVGTDVTEYFAQAETAPHAICLAVLLAVGAAPC